MAHNPFDSLTSEYEKWFIENGYLFQSELLALKQVVPVVKEGIEIGIGSGIFAENPGNNEIERPMEGYGKASFVVIKGV